MQASSFPCPYCSAPLRVQDRMYIGTQVPCPDCCKPIRIIADGAKGLAAEKVEVEGRKSRRRKAAASSDNFSDSSPDSATATAAVSQLDTRSRKRKAKRSGKTKPRSKEPARPESPRFQAVRKSLAACGTALASPLGVAWSVAGGCALLVVYLIVSTNANSDRRVSHNNSAQTGPQQQRKNAQPSTADAPPKDDVQARLTGLGEHLTAYVQEHGHFPTGTSGDDKLPPEDRFSWLAVLAADFAQSGGTPQWDQAWHHPSNDRFVRRSLTPFLNPSVGTLVDAQGYPAGHFVGMAGVGADAARLLVDHPRAGIFGYRRRTRLEDVTDGLANTIMVAGGQERLGAWAAGGPGSVRGLVREPYINGPDGFGTGQPDGMFVLMADGSVRFVSSDTSPTILRRMAAMADGLDLDPNTPGEPGDGPPSAAPRDPAIAQDGSHAADEPPMPEPPPAPQPDDPPGSPAVAQPIPNKPPSEHIEGVSPPVRVLPADEPESVDVEAALAQQILQFNQATAAPFSELLFMLEEMAGVPIRYDDQTVDSELLGKPVRLKLERTTVGGILQALVESQDLAYEIESNAIRIIEAKR